jgi:hypothetical protein
LDQYDNRTQILYFLTKNIKIKNINNYEIEIFNLLSQQILKYIVFLNILISILLLFLKNNVFFGNI